MTAPRVWPVDGGEMGAQVRAHDWATTPLGPPEAWPPTLRAAVDLILPCPLGMIVLWGPDLLQIYNDGYRDVMGAKHPAGLGQATQACWPEVWDFNAPIYAAVRRGESRAFQDQPLTIGRHGRPEETWFDLNFSPLRDEADAVAGVLVTVVETTGRALAERRLRASEDRGAYLLELSDALRPLADPAAIQAEAMRVLGQYLGAARAQYYEVDPTGEWLTSAGGYTDGVPPVIGRFRLDDFGSYVGEAFRAGQTLAVADVSAHPHVGAAALEAYDALGVRAFVGVPLVKGGQFVAALALHHAMARDWTAEDLTLVEETAERTWAAVERARTAATLRDSEERFRALVTAGSYPVYRMSPDWRRMYQLLGREILADTAAPVEGWAETYILPEDLPAVQAAIAAAIRGGSLFELEHRVRRADGGVGWVLSRAVPIRDAAGQIVEWFGAGTDVTERKRAEAALRESEARQTFLLALADRLRPLDDTAEVLSVATRALGEHLGADRVGYAEDRDGKVAVLFDYVRGVPSLVGRYRYEDYGPELLTAIRQGRSVIRPDIANDPSLTAAEKEAHAKLELGATVNVPLLSNGALKAILFLHFRAAHPFDAREITLLQGVAERMWASVQRVRAEAALREGEERLRLALDAAEMGTFVWYAEESRGEPDARMLALLGVTPGSTLTLREALSTLLHPDDRDRYAAAVTRALDPAGDGVLREEVRVVRPDGSRRWLSIAGQTRFGTGRRRVTRMAGTARDVTERRVAEAVLRASEERGAFLLRLNDALRPLNDPVAVQGEACRLLGEQLRVDRAYYVEMNEAVGVPCVERDWLSDSTPSLAREHGIADFAWSVAILRRGECHVVADTQTSPLVSPEDRPALAALGIRACMGAPLIKGARLVGALCVTVAHRRAWTESEVQLLREVGERIWAAVERARAEAALRESEERFRSFAEHSADTLWIVDAETMRLEYLSPAYEVMWGEGRERVLRDLARWAELLHPEDRAHALGGMPRLLAGETYQQEYRVIRPDGTVCWIQDTGFPIRDAAGRVRRGGGIAQDVTARREIEERLAESRRHLDALVEGMPQLVWRAVDGGHWTWASPQWSTFTGLSDAASRGHGWLDALHPEDRGAAMAAWGQAEAAGRLDLEYRVHHADEHRYRWFQTRATPVHDEAGAVVEWLGTSTDVDELRRLQERQGLLLAELQHRVRNTLGVVRSIARRTAATSETVEDYASHLDGRVGAFARVQGAVTRDPAAGVTVAELVADELTACAAQEGEQVSLAGPEIRLGPKAAETFGLAVHELATNAVKHGALATPQGRVDVAWRVEPDEGTPWLVFTWQESGVTLSPDAPRRRGFGTDLLERTLAYELRATTRCNFTPGGLRCTITVPLTPRTLAVEGVAPSLSPGASPRSSSVR